MKFCRNIKGSLNLFDEMVYGQIGIHYFDNPPFNLFEEMRVRNKVKKKYNVLEKQQLMW